MRIGIAPSEDHHPGGIYKYGLTMLQTLFQHKREGCPDEFSVFSPLAPAANLMSMDPAIWLSGLIQPPSFTDRLFRALRGVVGEGPHREVWRRFRRTKWQKNQPKREEVQ